MGQWRIYLICYIFRSIFVERSHDFFMRHFFLSGVAVPKKVEELSTEYVRGPGMEIAHKRRPFKSCGSIHIMVQSGIRLEWWH